MGPELMGTGGAGAPPAEVVIGLDVGTTGVKAIAFGLGSSWRRLAMREYELFEPEPGWQVQDLGEILRASTEALAECVAYVNESKVLAVSLSAAMHGLLALDARRCALTPLVTWADARATDEARWLVSSGQAAELHRRNGTPVHPMTPLAKLLWFARNDQSTCAAARWWVGLKECLLSWLTGELATELSSASGTGLLEMSTRSWSASAAELAGIRVEQLAPILSTTAVLGLCSSTAARIGLKEGTPVVAGAGDGPLANLGTGALGPGVAALSLGTSGAVRVVVDEPRVDGSGRLFCYALTEHAWVLGSALSNGGIVLRWAGEALAPDLVGSPAGPSEQHGPSEQPGLAGAAGVTGAISGSGADERMIALASQAPPGCDGLMMVPYLLSERAPLWDPDLPGAYLGLRRTHTRAHLVRAAIEGVCLQLSLLVDQLEKVEPVGSIRATGGALRSPLWSAILAAALEKPLYRVGDAEGTALGAATLALAALGRAPGLGEALALFEAPGAAQPELVQVDSELLSAARATRATIPELAHQLERVAELFEPELPRRSPAGAPRDGAPC